MTLPMTLPMSSSVQASPEGIRFGSGQAVHRIEDPALLTGQGRFTDNVVVEGQTYLAFVRSPYAHARIVGVDVEAARAMPGVLAVHTGAELDAAGVKPLPTNPMFKRLGDAGERGTGSSLKKSVKTGVMDVP